MRVAVVGCGYVGLATAVGLAGAGHDVVAIEVDPDRLRSLRAGVVPFAEPGLAEALPTVRFAAALDAAADAEIALVAVPTDDDGAATGQVVRELARRLVAPGVIVVRGTLRPDRAAALDATPHALVVNPEFLRQGYALADVRAPARVVLGGPPAATEVVRRMYAALYGPDVPVVCTDLATACLAKLAANSMLALRVAFANELGRLAPRSGASVDDLVRILGLDPRIGPAHLRPSLGIGGSCLPKDARMLAAYADDLPLLAAIPAASARHLDEMVAAAERMVRDVGGERVAVWGQTFKPGTDDVRESAAVELVRRLVAAGLQVAAHDPAVLPRDPRAVVEGADLLVVATPWDEYAAVEPRSLRPRVAQALDPARSLGAGWRAAGWRVWPER